MKKAIFEELLVSVKQAGAIARGERAPSRTFKVDSGRSKSCASERGSASRTLPLC